MVMNTVTITTQTTVMNTIADFDFPIFNHLLRGDYGKI